MADCGGRALPGRSKRTRSATVSSSASAAIAPTFMLPERPLRPVSWSPGRPHSGAMRGKNMNSATITGVPNRAMRAAARSASANGGRPTGMWALISAVSKPTSATSMAMAVGMDCEKKKLLSIVKKPRKKITMASRRARASSVLSASSMAIRVTPASRPRMVRKLASVAATASTRSATSSQRGGRLRPPSARPARQASSRQENAPAHSGRCANSGSSTQAITPSRNSVSRASRGSCFRVVRRLMAPPENYQKSSYQRLCNKRWRPILAKN